MGQERGPISHLVKPPWDPEGRGVVIIPVFVTLERYQRRIIGRSHQLNI